MSKLSDRVRPNSEAAPWVIDEIKRLEAALGAKQQPINVGDLTPQQRLELARGDKVAPVGEREAFEAWAASVGYHTDRDRFQREYYRSTHTRELWRVWQAGAAYQRQSGAVMPESVGVLILGGMFHGGSGPELGDIDIEPDMRAIERIQMELVTSSDDVHLELFARLNGKE